VGIDIDWAQAELTAFLELAQSYEEPDPVAALIAGNKVMRNDDPAIISSAQVAERIRAQRSRPLGDGAALASS
jgi:hypothetical protein